jgi:hypothetical protein
MSLPAPITTLSPVVLQLARSALSANPAATLALGASLLLAGVARKIATQDAPLKRVRVGDLLDAEFHVRDEP